MTRSDPGAASRDRAFFLSHCFPRSLWPLWDRRTTWAILALLTLVGGLYLWQASEITSTQHRIRQLEKECEYRRIQNAELQKEITELTRVAVLSERARAQGFVVPQERIFIRLRKGGSSRAGVGGTR